MKRSIYRLGAITTSLLSLTVLFKVLHWPGGNILLLITCGGLIPLMSFLVAGHLNRQENEDNKNDHRFINY